MDLEQRDNLHNPYRNDSPLKESDLLVKAKVPRSDIHLLAKYVEGLGHLGVVTTIDRMSGEVVIQTTKYCWPDLKEILSKLPLILELELELELEKNN